MNNYLTFAGDIIPQNLQKSYVKIIRENQAELFRFVAQTYPNKDTYDFIEAYMNSKTRKDVDKTQTPVRKICAQKLGREEPAFLERSAL